jgi:DNA-binding XRE family transcriptional regulator
MKNRLRELRAAKQWSQSDRADQLDVSRQFFGFFFLGYAIFNRRYK